VTVTARKRSETLQEIPDSVTVFGESLIRDARIGSIKDFSALTPNLTVSSNFRSGLNFVTIRGLITPQVGEAPLAFVVDGVTVPSIEFINQGLHQIERIEVLRGPQGALYGKNAIGGAVNIVTKQPSDEFEGTLQMSYAEGGDRRISTAISGPIVEDKVYYRLSTNYRDFDGLIDNPFLNQEVDFVDDAYGIQGGLTFQLSEQATLSLQGRYSEVTQGSNYQAFITADQLEDFSIEPDQNALGIDESTLWTVSAKFDYESDYGDLTFIVGANDADILFFSDGDFTSEGPVPRNFFFPVTQNNPIQEDSVNLEARFSSPAENDFRWLIGAFYETRNRKVQFDQIDDLTPTSRVTHDLVKSGVGTGFTYVGERTVQDSEAYALFGQVNYDLTTDVELTLAMRYDSEEREAFDERAPDASDVAKTYSELQPKGSIAWQVNSDVLLSATYSKGFRSGGFNEYAPSVKRDYDEEISDTIELGAKTTWFDGRLLVNVALFHIQQEEAQFTRLNPTTFTLENLNVDEVEIRGLEVEVTAKPTENLQFTLGAGLIDNEITKNTGLDALTGMDLALTEGNSMPYVSDYNVNGSISYRRSLGGSLGLKTRLGFNTLGPRSFDIFNEITGETDPHTFVNASIGIEDEAWSVSLYGTNLTDEESPETVFLFNPLIRLPSQPRQVGVQFNYDF
jgi:iron complex outermembrane receptor protein